MEQQIRLMKNNKAPVTAMLIKEWFVANITLAPMSLSWQQAPPVI